MKKVILLDKTQAQEFEEAKELFPKEMQAFQGYETKEGALVCATQTIEPSKEGALVVAESDILPGHFYKLESYQEDYHKDLAHFLGMLFSKMGKAYFDFRVVRSQEEFQKMEEQMRTGGGIGTVVAGATMQTESQNIQQTRTQQQSTFTRKSGDFGGKCTPKELQDWLEQRGINHQALEKLGVAELVDTFLRNGEIKEGGHLEEHYEMEKIFEEASHAQVDFHTQIGTKKGLQNFFAKGFLNKIARLDLGVQAGGSVDSKSQCKRYEKYALFYAVKF
ncbi:hypothetical protein [Helicobacter mehlei]|uniref:Uncharacterized protein n=1 Tax=Helicobacter mehlei TaxID=2316080 RepID=A0A553V327_9HELI|nr:hypothetical protein [Helicobacter mehlei]TSA86898.1 hypothetical protein FNE76_00010 [Helicobacter mehlei]